MPTIKIDDQKYKIVKDLLKKDVSQPQISYLTGISLASIQRINKTKTLDEYHNLWRRGTEKVHTPAPVPAPILTDDKQRGGTLSANYQINRIYEALKEQNELLTGISNKLAFIVDELTR